MCSVGISCLDSSDPDTLEEYERAFFDAFERVPESQLVRRLWLWDDERRRLNTRIAQSNQSIWVSRKADGKIHIVIATHEFLDEAQSTAFGFRVPREPGIFEVLTFFASGPLSYKEIHTFWRQVIAELQSRKLERGYATSATPMLPLYRRAGWKVIQTTESAGELRHLLSYK